MIKIKQLTLNNVGPYQEQLFSFHVKKGHPDIHIFTGANGTGKTTILHSLASIFDNYSEPDEHKAYSGNNLHKRFYFFEEGISESDKIIDKSRKSNVDIVLGNTTKQIYKSLSLYGCKNCKNLHTETSILDYDHNKLDDYAYFDYLIDSYRRLSTGENTNNQKVSFAAFAYSGYRYIRSENLKMEDNQKFNPLRNALTFVKEPDNQFGLSAWIRSRYSKAAIEEIHGNKDIAEKYRKTLNNLIDSINELTDHEYCIKIETNPWQVGVFYQDKFLEFDILPDGLRSIMSWLGDLLMRLDEIAWEDKAIPVTEQNIILFLDEIEVHLHPTWQYKILPLVKRLFPNAQVFITTHSPFIINSIDNAKIYRLENNNGKSQLIETLMSETGFSISYVLKYILNAKNMFGIETVKNIERFNEIDAEIASENFSNENEFKGLVKKLAQEGDEVLTIISSKLFRLESITGKNYLNGSNN